MTTAAMKIPAEIPPPFSTPWPGAVPPSLSVGPPPGFAPPPEPELELTPVLPEVFPLPGPEKECGRSPGELSVAKEGVLITPGMGRGVAGEEGEARGAEGDSWGPDEEG